MKMNLLIALTLVGLVSECAKAQVCVSHLNVPKYPAVAWAAQQSGVVDLKLKIGRAGQVLSVEGKGVSPQLVEMAKANVRSWVFCAPDHGGNSTVHLRYDYRLKGARVYARPNPKIVIDLGEGTVVITLPPPEPQP
ncbi:MAG: energy transducer TonB [Acidobacteriota bacterium]